MTQAIEILGFLTYLFVSAIGLGAVGYRRPIRY